MAFKDSLGWVLYKQGKFAESKRGFDQILDAPAEEMHAIILHHAGDTCWRLGVKDQAVALWKRALEMAGKDKEPDRDARAVQAGAPKKIAAAEKGGRPKVAELGQDVKDPEGD